MQQARGAPHSIMCIEEGSRLEYLPPAALLFEAALVDSPVGRMVGWLVDGKVFIATRAGVVSCIILDL